MLGLRSAICAASLIAIIPVAARAQDQMPAAIAAPGEAVVATLQAEGAQIYECKPGAGGLSWVFREPIATLMVNGKTVGRHYAGPNWEYVDGSGVAGKVAASAPGPYRCGHPLAQTRRHQPPGPRDAVGREHHPADRHPRRRPFRTVRRCRHLFQRALFGGVRVPAARRMRAIRVGKQHLVLLMTIRAASAVRRPLPLRRFPPLPDRRVA